MESGKVLRTSENNHQTVGNTLTQSVCAFACFAAPSNLSFVQLLGVVSCVHVRVFATAKTRMCVSGCGARYVRILVGVYTMLLI